MFPSLYIAIILGQLAINEPPQPPPDLAQVSASGHRMELTWSDAEDRLQGSYGPTAPVAHQEIDVTVRVGSFDGPAWTGPITLSLKPVGIGPGESHTVARDEASGTWSTRLTCGDAGPHALEIGFTTTRHKVVRATLEVAEPALARWPWWVAVGLFGALAIGLGVRAVVGKKT